MLCGRSVPLISVNERVDDVSRFTGFGGLDLTRDGSSQAYRETDPNERLEWVVKALDITEYHHLDIECQRLLVL